MTNDYISRQDAVEAITNTSGIRGDALKALYDLPSAQPEHGWIPVSERLPELKRNILFTTSQGFVAEGEYDGMFDGHHAWCQYRWSATLWDDEVIAWMPLPEPYKGEA